MAKRGPPPKPTHLKVLSGTNRKHRANNKEPNPGNDAMSPTEKLSEVERAIWNEMVPQLTKMGVAKDTDCHALTLLVKHEAIRRDIHDQLTQTGMLVVGSQKQIRVNPLFKAHQESSLFVARMLTEFGMTASSRTRIEVDPPSDDEGFGID